MPARPRKFASRLLAQDETVYYIEFPYRHGFRETAP